MIDISPIQILIVLAIALLVFGPKRLPEMGRSVGRGLREFRSGFTAGDDHDDDPRPSRPPERAAAVHSASAHEDDDLEGVVVPGDAPPGAHPHEPR